MGTTPQVAAMRRKQAHSKRRKQSHGSRTPTFRSRYGMLCGDLIEIQRLFFFS
jgi:hypothetical protein